MRDARDAIITRMFNDGGTYSTIGEVLGVTRNSIASACRRLGLTRGTGNIGVARARRERNPISASERVEREQDQRDIDILCDIAEGHSQSDCAAFWGVSKTYVHLLVAARRAA